MEKIITKRDYSHPKLLLRLVFPIMLTMMSQNHLMAQEDPIKELADAIIADNHSLIREIAGTDSSLLDTTYFSKGFLSSARKNIFHIALASSDSTTIDLLLELGADPNKESTYGAIMRAEYRSSLEVLCKRGKLSLVKRYIDQLDVSYASYTSALKRAADNKDNDIVRFLLSKGEEILIDKTDPEPQPDY